MNRCRLVLLVWLSVVGAVSCTNEHTAAPTPAPTAAAPTAAAPTAVPARVPSHHRAAPEACSTEKVSGNADARLAAERSAKCKSDADCTRGNNGRCAEVRRMPGEPFATCVYDACVVDSDCGEKSMCDCGTSASDGHSCMPGNCAVDSDCAGNGFCSPSQGKCGNGVAGYFCHTATDECVDDADCAVGSCVWNASIGHWWCATNHCVQ